jgi:hypothetical protein
MRQLRGILTGIALIGLTGVSLLAAAQVAWRGMQGTSIVERPYQFDRLHREDLATASEVTRRQFVRGLEQDLERGIDWRSRMEELNDEQRDRLQENLTLLAEDWFNAKVDRYFELPSAERDAFIEGLFGQVERWAASAQATANVGGDEDGGTVDDDRARGQMALFGPLVLSRAQEWLEKAPPERQEQIREFQTAVQTRLFLRALEQAGRP